MLTLKVRGIPNATRMGLQISAVGTAIFAICAALGLVLTVRLNNPIPVATGIAIGFYFLFAIRVAEQWERAAVLRFGRYIGLRGPGIFMIVPVIDQISVYVDQRVRVVQVSAETALGFLAPAGTPKPLVERLSREIRTAVDSGALSERLKANATEIELVGSTPDEFRDFIAKEIPQWRAVIKAANIPME